jgi:ElaB/YqjD/DUF883 family membrane-anchored ribosome-binding protein
MAQATPHSPIPGDLREKAHQQVDKAAQQAEQVAQTVSKQAEAVGENVQQVASALQKSLQKQPLTTIAMAVFIGVALGALWKVVNS